MHDQQTQFLTILIPLLVVGLVLRRNLRPRQLKIERLWVTPLIIFLLMATSLATNPPTGTIAFIALPIALILGAIAGWYRGRLTNITIDPETHDLTSKASPFAMVLIAALFVVRYGLRYYLDQSGGSHGALGSVADVITDGLLVFSVGMMSVQRVEMWIRASRLLSEAQATKAR